MKRVAIIPARGGSKRLARKNVLDLEGRPMLVYPVEAAKNSALFDAVIVSTEDAEIAEVARSAGAEVLVRPDALADDQSTVVEVCLHMLESLARKGKRPETFCCLYATAVFITPEDIKASMALLDGPPEADVVMGVSGYPIHPYSALEEVSGYLQPVWPELQCLKSQHFPRLLTSNGTIYWAGSDRFLRNPTFFPDRLIGYEIPTERAVDIDSIEDLEWARKLARLHILSKTEEKS